MKHLGYINTEGGPLLIADAAVAKFWEGTYGDGADYKRACKVFDDEPDVEGGAININNQAGLLWEMDGAGTADVFMSDHLVIVRTWPTDQSENTTPSLLANEPLQNSFELGNLTVDTGAIAVFWAAENGKNIQPLKVPPIKTAIPHNSGLITRVDNGTYSCLHDEVETKLGVARRLHLIKSH